MQLDTFHSPTPLYSYNAVTLSGDFSFKVSLSFRPTSIQFHALLDSSASTCFIDISFSRAYRIPTVCIQPLPVKAIDGWVLSSRAVTEATLSLELEIGCHKEELTFFLIASPRHPVILGLSWF